MLERCAWDYGDGTGRFVEAAHLTEKAIGLGIPEELQGGLISQLTKYIQDDGLFYSPKTPWTGEGHGDIWYQRGVITGLLTLCETDPDPEDLGIINRMVEALDEIAIRSEGDTYFYYAWDRDHRWKDDLAMSPAFALNDVLTQCAQITGNEKALTLAGELCHSMLMGKNRCFDEEGHVCFPASSDEVETFKKQQCDWTLVDGAVVIESQSAWLLNNGHATSRSMALLGLIRYSVLTGDRDLLARGKQIYDQFVADYCTQFGWAPENFLTAGQECSEMCTTADLIISQILLARAGFPEYWEHTERFLRNHVYEAQVMVHDTLRGLEERYATQVPGDPGSDHRVYNQALDRLAGGFAGPIYPDDQFCFYPKSRRNPDASRTIDISGCCSPSGIKAVAIAMQNAITIDQQGIQVNLLMDRDDEMIAIRSEMPERGVVTLTPKKAMNLSVRIPSWCQSSERLEFTVNDRRAPITRKNGYADLGPIQAGSRIDMVFDLTPSTETLPVDGLDYDVSWRGYDVVSLKSRGDYKPLMSCYHDL